MLCSHTSCAGSEGKSEGTHCGAKQARVFLIKPTLEIDPVSGAVTRAYTPDTIRFKDEDLVRPVAPFLELFAQTSEDTLEPLTLDLLAAEGLGPQDVYWTVKPTVSPLTIPLIYCHIKSFQRASSVGKPLPGGEKRRGGRAAHPIAL